MPAKKPHWEHVSETMWVKHTPTIDLVVSQIPMSGDWRAEYVRGHRFGRLQIARTLTKDEAIKVCEEYDRNNG